jgi:Kdo2-lipid IVA lauroyltransferase/acyltransferase
MRDWAVKTRKWLELEFLVWFARFIKICALVIPYRLGVWIGGMVGFFAYLLITQDRKRAITHLKEAFTEKDERWIRRTAMRNFIHLGKAMFEFALITPRRLTKIFDLHGMESVHAALQRGKGAIYVTGHLGNWELMADAGVAGGVPLSVIAAPIRPEQVNDMVIELRDQMGVKTIVRSKPGAAKALIRIFKENRVLAILIDQDTDVEGVFVDFMGKAAWTPTAAAAMAIKFDAPIFFGYAYRDAHNRHTGTVEGPLDLVRTGNEERDIIANTAMLSKKIEKCVRNKPEQWVWMHRRWRRQP